MKFISLWKQYFSSNLSNSDQLFNIYKSVNLKQTSICFNRSHI